MSKSLFNVHFDVACEAAGIQVADAFLAAGLVDAFGKWDAIELSPRSWALIPRVRGVGVSPTLSPFPEPKAPPPKPNRFGQCKVYPYTACISLRCHEDGFCRQTGEEIVTAC